MTDIPDAISSDTLKALLDGTIASPHSDQIPEINFGLHFGGPCDLQFVVSSIIAKSTHGVNFIQLLMTALHLLTEGERHLRRQQDVFMDPDGKASSIPTREREAFARTIERHNTLIRSSVLALEQVLEAYAPMSSQVRIQELTNAGLIDLNQKISLDQLRSILLFSDELLDSLGISRDDITKYLNSSDSFTS